MNSKVRTCLWFDGKGEEAAEFYVSLLPNSSVKQTYRPDPQGPPLIVEFTLDGTPYQILNGGQRFPQTEAASITVMTDDQVETDRLWNTLTADGGTESRCGWLKDKYGVSWQIVPRDLVRLLTDNDRAAAGRAMEAMLKMTRIDIAAAEEAFHHAQD